MKKRLITGAIMLAVILPLVLINNEVCEILYCVLTMFMCGVGAYEFVSKAFKDREGLLCFKIIVPIFSVILGFLACQSTSSYAASKIISFSFDGTIVFAYMVLALLLEVAIIFLISLFLKNSTAHDVSSCVCALLYTGVMLGFAMSIRYLNNISTSYYELNGTRCFMYVYTIVIMTDSFAYLFGKAFGKSKLCPNISPNKTKEGALAGLIGGSICGVLGLYIYNIVGSFEHALYIIPLGLLLSAVISCTVQFGDLVESKFKRTYDVKDFGYILPGHGGILDRFDSFIYSGTIFYVFIMAMELIILG